jgi:hypothetical protein
MRGLVRGLTRFAATTVIAMLTLALSAGRAEAITLTEIVELTRAGLSDDVILALIEVDQRVFSVDPDTLKALKEAGVSQRVIVAIVKSGRTPQPQVEPPVLLEATQPPPPQVVVVDRPVIQEVPVAVPVPVHVTTVRRSHGRHSSEPYVVPPLPFAPFGSSPSRTQAVTKEPSKRAEPVYWGFGGKLRPDAWGQPAKDAKPK